MHYDVAVIGNDEAALEMACLAASAGQSTVAILPESRHSAWIVAQTLRGLIAELLANLTEARRQRMQTTATPRLLRRLIAQAIITETHAQIARLKTRGVDVLLGEARFHTAETLLVSCGVGPQRHHLHARNVVIGTGVRRTSVHRPLGLVPFHQPEALFEGVQLPDQLTILGGGDVGAGLTALFQLFGVPASWITSDVNFSGMSELALDAGVEILTECTRDDSGRLIVNQLPSQNVVDCRRSVGFTENLNLISIGVEPDEHGQLWCSECLETWCTGVFGIGSVVGFTSSTATSATRQAGQILNRLTHRIRRPHFLNSRNYALAGSF